MNTWPTFQIFYPNSPNYSVMGIVVPNDFQTDSDCLNELGFTLGTLDSIQEVVSIILPMPSKYANLFNTIRARKIKEFSSLKKVPYIEIHDKYKRISTFIRPKSIYSGLLVDPNLPQYC